MRGLYKKIDKAATSWDIYCDCVKTNPALKKIIRRKLRKPLTTDLEYGIIQIQKGKGD